MPPVIDKTKCVHCGICAEICPTGVFSPEKEKGAPPEILFPDECWHCNSCVLDCKAKAVSLRIPLPYMLLHVDASEILGKGE